MLLVRANTQKLYSLGKGETFFPPIHCNISFMGILARFSKKNVIRNISVVEYVAAMWLYLLFCFCLETVRIVDVHI